MCLICRMSDPKPQPPDKAQALEANTRALEAMIALAGYTPERDYARPYPEIGVISKERQSRAGVRASGIACPFGFTFRLRWHTPMYFYQHEACLNGTDWHADPWIPAEAKALYEQRVAAGLIPDYRKEWGVTG